MKNIHLILALLCLCTTSFGQAILKGKVYDASNNAPLPGATVRVSGNGGTTTDKQGMFSLECTGGEMEITVSFVGYQSYKQTVTNCGEELTVMLTPGRKDLDAVEITATTNADKSLLRQPASIVKMGRREITRGTGLFMDDAINANVPGVYMTRRGVSSGQQLNIRGYGNGVGFKGANNNFDIQGTKVYLNGMPLTDAEGVTVLDDIDFASIGNVEVVKGPAGTLYGLAIAGAVNLQTVKPEPGKTSIGQSVLIGDYGVQRYTTSLQMGLEKSSLLVNYGHQTADGFMEHTASEKDFVNVAGEFRISEKQTVSSYFGYSDSYDERGGELTIKQYHEFDYSGNARYIKNNAHSEVISFRAGLSHKYDFNENVSNTTTVFGSAASMNSSSAAGWNDNHPVNYGFRSTLDFNFDLGENFHLSGIAGGEAQQQKSQPVSYGMVPDSSNLEGYNIIGSLRGNQISNSGTYSYFTQWTLGLPKDFSLTAGIGVSNMHIELDNREYVPNNPDPVHYEASYENLVSPHVALNKVFSENLSAYAAYSKGYKAPVSGNIVISGTGELNTGLVPEEGEQYEVGTKGMLHQGRLHYQLALFQAFFTHKMTSVAVPLDSVTTAYTYIANSGGQDNKGVEVLLKYDLVRSETGFFSLVRPWANATYSYFRYEDFAFSVVPRGGQLAVTEIYDGNAVAGVSPVVFNAGIDFNLKPGIYGNVNYNYHDPMPIVSSGAFHTHAYQLVNAKLGYRHGFGRHFQLDVFAGANNITGAQHYYMVFINQLADAYMPAPSEINFFGGVDLRYNF